MNATSSLNLITSSFVRYGSAVLVIFGLFLGIAIGVLIFYSGFRKVASSTGLGYSSSINSKYASQIANSELLERGLRVVSQDEHMKWHNTH